MRVRVSGMNPNSIPRLNPPLDEKEEQGGGKNSERGKAEEALNHPLVKEAINIFGGRVVEIKNL